MARDCEKLSPKALEIFGKLKPHFPPDPWKKPQWFEDGRVYRNGSFDLRKSSDRQRLERDIQMFVGYLVGIAASSYRRKNGSLEGFAIEHLGDLNKAAAELLLLLQDLDFQIETADLIES